MSSISGRSFRLSWLYANRYHPCGLPILLLINQIVLDSAESFSYTRAWYAVTMRAYWIIVIN
jgi:hypothetical protein